MPNLPNTNFFPVNSETYSSTLSASIGAGVPTVPVASASPYLDNDVVVLTVDPDVAGKQATFTGTKSGSSFINCTWTEGNVGVGHDGGAVIKDYDSATHTGLISKGARVSIDQDGTFKAGAVDNAAVLANNVVTTAKILDSNVTTAKLNDDAVTAAKLIYGLVRQRQGGTTGAGSWGSTGTSNTDTSATDVFIQVGSTTPAGGSATVTFPVAFNQVPIVMATSQVAIGIAIASTITTTNFVLSNFTTGNSPQAVATSWVAIGQ